MSFLDLPMVASWRHCGARAGFEVVFFVADDGGWRVEGTSTATEDGRSWIVDYLIKLDGLWLTRFARVTRRTGTSSRTIVIEADGMGGWRIDGEPAEYLRGCLDLDLEASVMTNTFPVHRLELPVGGLVSAPAAYVRAVGLAVERLEQTYRRCDDHGYDYTAPVFAFASHLFYDEHGLIVDYPDLATRVA
jgi:uncharacterized protein